MRVLLAALFASLSKLDHVSSETCNYQLSGSIEGDKSNFRFGRDIASSENGEIVAIGSDNIVPGRVQVWKEGGSGTWEEMGTELQGSNEMSSSGNFRKGENFGFALDLSSDGMTLAVGAYSEGEYVSGGLFVYTYNGSSWVAKGQTIYGQLTRNRFGIFVSMSGDGNRVAGGAQYNEGDGQGLDITPYGAGGPNSVNKGRVRVFDYDAATNRWEQVGQYLDGLNPGDQQSSCKLSKDGKRIAVGAWGYDIDPSQVTWEGMVRVYELQDATWEQIGQNIIGTAGAYVGMDKSMALNANGSFLAVGDKLDRGTVRVYEDVGGNWVQRGQVIQGDTNNAQFRMVSLSDDGSTLSVGDNGYDANDGNGPMGETIVYVFDSAANSWNPIGSPNTWDLGTPDYLGFDIALEAGGDRLFAAAPTFVGTEGEGIVRVYDKVCYLNPYHNPSVSGDPHIKTWTGERYDFHGVCDLVMMKNPHFANNLGMDVHIRTKRTKSWSYISSAVVRIGEHTLEVMGVKNDSEWTSMYWVDGVADAAITNLSGYSIKHESINSLRQRYEILLSQGSIVIETFKDFVRVDFDNVIMEDFDSSLGLLGSYGKGEMIGRDGITIVEDTNEFGQMWQVLPSEPMLFHNVEGPQAPEKCHIPDVADARKRLRRRLKDSISEEDARLACSRVDPSDFDVCVFDVMATDDLEVPGAY